MNLTRFTRCAAAGVLAGGLAAFAELALAQAPDGMAHGHGHGGDNSHDHGHDQPQAAADAAHGHGDAHAGTDAADAALSTQPETPQAGDRATLSFTLTDTDGRPLEELITHHARKLHVVIVSEDMAVLGHIHPQDFDEPIAGGETSVHFTFPRAGRYLVAADIMTEAGPYAEQFLVEVAGGAEQAQASAADAARVAVVQSEGGDRYTEPVALDGADTADGYELSLAKPDRIEAGEPTTFTFRVAKAGAPVTDLRPFLDAPLHLAVVNEDLTAFLHVHGTAAEEAEAGHAAHGAHGHAGEAGDHAHGSPDAGGHGSHGSHGYTGPASFGPELTATFTFPEPGRYHLFGQAAHGEKLLISRFPVDVQ